MADRWNDEEDRYWREHYAARPYASGGSYATFRPGYRYGYEAARLHRGRAWADVERELEREWNSYPHHGRSTWQQVKLAVRDAWDRAANRTEAGHGPEAEAHNLLNVTRAGLPS